MVDTLEMTKALQEFMMERKETNDFFEESDIKQVEVYQQMNIKYL